MHVFIVYCVLCLLFTTLSARSLPNNNFNYEHKPWLVDKELKQYLGGTLILNDEEEKVNQILMKWKDKEITEAFHHPQHYNFSKHYFTYKNDMEKSSVYKIIKQMPKGAALHVHSSMMLHADDMIDLTYEDHLYVCHGNNTLNLQFSEDIPERPCQFNWTLLNEVRNANGDAKAYDAELKNFFTLYTDDENIQNADINYTWRKFNNVYSTIKSLISYRPVREKFFYKALKRFYDDNVMYIEIRTGLHELYELDGSKHEKIYLAKLYQNVTEQFIADYPDFVGIKLILTKKRLTDANSVNKALEFARQVKTEMPDLFAGFDLVGQEDLGKPLSEFVPELAEAKNDIDFYFHAGETNWLGLPSDENLFEAVELGSKRIGHAFALIKHPALLAIAQERDIALEVNVISNVVLSLVRDVRNHPLATYLALGYPVVLSSDDPGAWDAEPLSHDFYITFMGVASKHADLRLLKTLATNSIRYSTLDDTGKKKLFKVFNVRWNQFLQDVQCTT